MRATSRRSSRCKKSRKKRIDIDRLLHRLCNLVRVASTNSKNAHRVANHYDQTMESFLGFIDTTSIRLWLRHLST